MQDNNYRIVRCTSEDAWLQARHELLTASDAAAANDMSRYKSRIDLFLEKTGIREEKDLSAKLQIIRGKEREPIIREAFAADNPWFKVVHEPYDIYVSTRPGYEMLGATLDGRLEVVADNPYHMPIGASGVLEIKSVRYEDIKTLDKDWGDGHRMPDYYYAQVLQQLFVTGFSFAFLVPEFHYEGQDLYLIENKEYTIAKPRLVQPDDLETAADMQYIADGCKTFWTDYVIPRQMPEKVIVEGPEDEKEVAVIEADVEVGRFFDNFNAVRSTIERMVEPYTGIIYTEDMLQDAKEVHSKLNALSKQIDEIRIAVKKKYLEPYNLFDAAAKELKDIIEKRRVPIKEQLDGFETERRKRKQAEIDAIWDELIAEIPDDLREYAVRCNLPRGNDSAWLNKSASMKSIRKAISLAVAEFQKDYAALKSFGDDKEIMQGMLAEYERTLNLKATLELRERLIRSRENARKIMEERQRQEAEIKQKANARTSAPTPETAPATESKSNGKQNDVPNTERKLIKVTFEAYHQDLEAYKGLVAYMKSNGFRFRKI